MNLMLVLPENTFLDDDSFVAPLGPLYVANVMKSTGKFNDIRILKWNDFVNIASSLKSNDIVGITGASIHEEYFKELPKLINSNVYTMAGGALATVAPNRILDYGYNLVVRGKFQDLLDVPKFIGKNHQPCIYESKYSNDYLHMNIDFSLVEEYFPLNERIGLMSSHGCPYSCAFCAKIMDKFILADSSEFTKKVESIKAKYNPSMYIFYDDNILIKPPRFIDLAFKLSKLDIKWRSQARSNFVTEDIIKVALDSGCIQLSFGVESGSQKILDNVNKQIKVYQNTKAFSICKKMGLKTKAFIMIGLPGETAETIEETRKWVLDNSPDFVSLYSYFPFEGSDIYKNSSAYDIKFDTTNIKKAYALKNGISPVIVRTKELTSKELADFREDLVSDFRKSGIVVY